MTYLDELAAEIEQQLPSDLLPDENPKLLYRLYALLALIKGTGVTDVDVHNAWATWMAERDPDHRFIRPFVELEPEVRATDEPFAEAIRVVAGRHGLYPA